MLERTFRRASLKAREECSTSCPSRRKTKLLLLVRLRGCLPRRKRPTGSARVGRQLPGLLLPLQLPLLHFLQHLLRSLYSRRLLRGSRWLFCFCCALGSFIAGVIIRVGGIGGIRGGGVSCDWSRSLVVAGYCWLRWRV
jgi:hypothetical protein